MIVVVVAIIIKRKKVKFKKRFFYWGFITFVLAIISLFMALYQSNWLSACFSFMFLVFSLLFIYIASASTISSKKTISFESQSRYRWIAHLLSNLYEQSGIFRFFLSLGGGLIPAFFVILIAGTLLSAIFDNDHTMYENDNVSQRPHKLTQTYPAYLKTLMRYEPVGTPLVIGIVTLSVTFLFGFFIRLSIGAGTGLWVGFVSNLFLVANPIYTIFVCVICGYIGDKLGLWTHRKLLQNKTE